jgi:hypothetical protein
MLRRDDDLHTCRVWVAGNMYTTSLEIAAPDLLQAQRVIQAAIAGVREPPPVIGVCV